MTNTENYPHWKWADRLFLAALFFIVLEQGIQLRIGYLTPYKIFYGAWIFCLLSLQIKKEKTPVEIFVKNKRATFAPLRWILNFLCAFVLFDLFSLAYTVQKDIAMVKYISIVPMAVLFLYLSIYFRGEREENKKRARMLVLALGTPSLVLIAISLLSLLFTGRTYYFLKVSLIHDYNKFGTVLILGFLLLAYWVLTSKMKWERQGLLLFAMIFIYYTMNVLTASRRGPLIFLGVSIFVLALMNLLTRKESKRPWMLFILSVALILTMQYASNQILIAFDQWSLPKYETMVQEAKRTGKDYLIEKSLKKVHDESEAGGLDKRQLIWKIAIDEIKSFNTLQMFFGKGASTHKDIYNTEENHRLIAQLYETSYEPEIYQQRNVMDPHNFLLVEWLNGGLIKTLLLVGLCLMTFIRIIQVYTNQKGAGLILLLFSGVILLNAFLSSKHGLIESKDTWILLLLLIVLPQITTTKGRKRKE